MDTHIGPPFSAGTNGFYQGYYYAIYYLIYRRHKQFATFYKDVPEILTAIYNTKRIDIAIASRTEEPEWAKEIIELVKFSNGETLCIK